VKLGVSIREAGWLLGKSEPQVRRLLRAGQLELAVPPARITPASVAALFPTDEYQSLRQAAMTAILECRIKVPAPATRYARPAPITELPRLLAAAQGAKRTVRSHEAPPAFDSVSIVPTSPL
jgi:hypothetical protein